MEYYVDLEWICDGLFNLVIKHWDCFEQSREREEIDNSIFHCRIALGLYSEEHPSRNRVFNNLGTSLVERFQHYRGIDDLQEAIKCFRSTLELCPDGHPDRSKALSNLARAQHTRFEQFGKTTDIDDAVKYHCAALKLCPDGHPDRYTSLNNLANTLKTRFKHYGRTTDLDEAIKHHCAALELRPYCHPDHYMSLNNLANALQTRFERFGQTTDIDETVKYHCAALESCAVGYPCRPNRLNNLAISLETRFQRNGQTADLNEAIEFHRAALEIRSVGDPDNTVSLYNLAASLRLRFEQYGQTADLEEAISYHRAVLKLCPVGHPDHPAALNSLARSLQTRFIGNRQAADLDEAIEYDRATLELYPIGHPECFKPLNDISVALQIQFEYHGRTADLDKAIKHHCAVLELHPVGHPFRSRALSNRAASLQLRFKQYGKTSDLDEAIDHHHAALELRPVGHPDRSGSLVNLGLALSSRFERIGLMDDFEECMQLLECATVHTFSSLMDRLKAANLWARHARRYSHRTTSRAYKEAMLLLQRALTVSPSLPAQHDFLNEKKVHRMLALDAVAYAVGNNRLKEAIEILEQGRGLLWSQMRGLRAPLDHLTEVNKELANRFRDVSRRLENLAMSPTELQSGSSMVGHKSAVLDVHRERRLYDERLKLKRRLSTEQEELINEIRRIPGFESFLKATPFNLLQRAASEGPVIVVNHSEYRSDVLIVLSHEDKPVVCVPLDGEFYKDSVELYVRLLTSRKTFGVYSRRYDETLGQTMKILWDRVVSKVVDKFNELGIAEGSRIWWCPTFVLSALPFHAAGPFEDTDGTINYLLDKYISSYTPTLGALIDAQSSSGNGEELSALVVGDTSLPSAKKEIRNIKNCGIQTSFLSSKASHDAVIEALQETRWVHFVCHGCLGPFNSSFKVSSCGLSLLDIIQANLPRAEFAFLSACHTAGQSFEVVFDEVLHLAAAMHFSGFRNVIGSMWELLDVDGPFFAKTVYEYMCDCDEGEARYKRAAAGLRKAAVELKGRPEVRAERWVNLIHIGA